MATITGLLGSLTHWLVLASQWFHDWDITLLTSALIVLIVIAGVTGRAIEVAIIWTIVTRYLPVCDMSALIRNILRHEPSMVIAQVHPAGGCRRP